MAFLIDRGIAAESEEEFDAEGDRYEELRSRLFGGRTMKYDEMEELLAAAKARNDQKVVGALKNVVDDPATDMVTESEKEPTKAELLDKLIKMCKTGSGLRIALEKIKDKERCEILVNALCQRRNTGVSYLKAEGGMPEGILVTTDKALDTFTQRDQEQQVKGF